MNEEIIKNMPILKALSEYAGTLPVAFHMPGHKLGKGFQIEEFERIGKYDVTEIPGTDNLHFPEGAIKEAQELAAKTFGADETFFLVNGSTCGIHAAIMSVCKEGDKLIVSRDCHKSVIGGLMLARAVPVYVKPKIDKSNKLPLGGDIDALISAMDENLDAKGVFITRPNYYGICSDIVRLVKEAHKRGMVVIADEAHGAHLRFSPHLPICAMDAGADIAIQSTHKTLPAFTQTALLHIKGQSVDRERLAFYLRLLQTSSPSYLFMASIDYARAFMELYGRELLNKLEGNIKLFEEKLLDTEYYVIRKDNFQGFKKDFTRLVINTSPLGITGYEVEKLLRQKFNIQVEMSDYYSIVCIVTVSDSMEDLILLAEALNSIAPEFRKNKALPDINIEEQTILPNVSFSEIENKAKEDVPLKSSAGRICADIVTPYPPGIPYICPGEIIMEESIELLYNIVNAGGKVNGLTPEGIIKVIKDDR
jgi:arginine decarboxylase